MMSDAVELCKLMFPARARPGQTNSTLFFAFENKRNVGYCWIKSFSGAKKEIKGDNKAILTIFADSSKDSH